VGLTPRYGVRPTSQQAPRTPSEPEPASSYLRLAVGEYRVIYRDDEGTVHVVVVGKRNDGECTGCCSESRSEVLHARRFRKAGQTRTPSVAAFRKDRPDYASMLRAVWHLQAMEFGERLCLAGALGEKPDFLSGRHSGPE
jgi:hypothetical protein